MSPAPSMLNLEIVRERARAAAARGDTLKLVRPSRPGRRRRRGASSDE